MLQRCRAMFVAHRVLDVLVAEVVLQRPGGVAVIGELESRRRAEGGWMANGILAILPRRSI